jgi:non-ribosomal peptide synthetase component F
VPQTYTAWGAAERAFWQPAELESRATFWKSHLAGYQRLWADREGLHTAAGPLQRLVSHLSPELASAARDLAKRSSATLFSTLLSAFQVAFSRWSGTDDVLVGAPVANRTRANTKETMGYFAGVVPLRGQIDPQRTFAASLQTTQATAVECFANAMPFAELARAVGEKTTPGHPPIFEVRFALQNHPIPDVALPGLSAKLRMRSTGTARFHLACEVTEEGDQFEVVWLFRPQLFPQGDVERLGRLFRQVLTEACQTPEKRIAELALSES